MIGSIFNSRLVSSRRSQPGLAGAVLFCLLFASGATMTPGYGTPDGKTAAAKSTTAVGTAKANPKSPTQSSARSLPKVMDFSAVWCGPCKRFAPVFDRVAKNYKDKIEFVHYDAETGPGKPLADKYKISILPTLIFMDARGKVTFRNEGVMKEEDLVKNTEALLK